MKKIYDIIDSVETLEKAFKDIREAQKVRHIYPGAGRQIFLSAATAANKAKSLLPKWRLRKREWAWLRIR